MLYPNGIDLNCTATCTLAVVSIATGVLVILQVREARRSYRATTFLAISEKMDGFRDARRLLHLCALRLRQTGNEMDAVAQLTTEANGRVRAYCGYLDGIAFLSEMGIVDCRWLVEMWGRTTARTWPFWRALIRSWRQQQGEPGLFRHLFLFGQLCEGVAATQAREPDITERRRQRRALQRWWRRQAHSTFAGLDPERASSIPGALEQTNQRSERGTAWPIGRPQR